MRTRFACFTKEQQATFETLNKKQQNYVIFRSQGMGYADAHASAGFSGKNHSQNGCSLENRDKPFIKDLIMAMSGQANSLLAMKAESKIAQHIDEIAKQVYSPDEITRQLSVPENSESVVTEGIDLEHLSVEKAKNIQFYRDIADGKTKTIKKTSLYSINEEGKKIKTGEKVEEICDVGERVKARKELMRLVGVADAIQLSQVSQKNTNIVIVDASNNELKEELGNE